MPIRPELRVYYGPEWRRFREEMIAKHGPYCMDCGWYVPDYLNLAHETHDPRRSEVALKCASCHALHDSQQRYLITRRTKARKHGQLWLLPEIEWAPFPDWQIPENLRDRVLQDRLF